MLSIHHTTKNWFFFLNICSCFHTCDKKPNANGPQEMVPFVATTPCQDNLFFLTLLHQPQILKTNNTDLSITTTLYSIYNVGREIRPQDIAAKSTRHLHNLQYLSLYELQKLNTYTITQTKNTRQLSLLHNTTLYSSFLWLTNLASRTYLLITYFCIRVPVCDNKFFFFINLNRHTQAHTHARTHTHTHTHSANIQVPA